MKKGGNWRTRWAERWRERVWVWREPAAEARRSRCSSLCPLSTTTRRSFRECDQTQLGSRSPNPHLHVIQPNTFTNSNILLRSAKILRLYSGLPGRTFPSFFFKSFSRFLFSLSAVNLCLAGAAGATGIWGVGCNLYTNFSGAIITSDEGEPYFFLRDTVASFKLASLSDAVACFERSGNRFTLVL